MPKFDKKQRNPFAILHQKLRRSQHSVGLKLLGNSAAARNRLTDLLAAQPDYKGPIFKTKSRTLVACGDHYAWVLNRDSGVGQGLIKHGAWQRADFDAAMSKILELRGEIAPVFLDVGANIGTTSIYAALSGHFSRILAIEPEPVNAGLIAENFAINDIQVCLVIERAACGAENGLIYLNTHETDMGMHHVSEHQTDRSLRVPLMTLPTIMERHDITPSDVGFIWIDIEGHELTALSVADELLQQRTPIFFEHGKERVNDSLQDIWTDRLSGLGYTSFIVKSSGVIERASISDALTMDFGNLLLV
jgi:FkbM family methyltransferase